MTSRRSLFRVSVILFITAMSCGPGGKLSGIRQNGISAKLSLPDDKLAADTSSVTRSIPHRDTLTVTDLDGREVIVMRAVKDDETGEMVATEELNAAVVTSRFRNVAERHGKVDLRFQVIVPSSMHDSKWQLRFHPVLFMLGDSLGLDDVVITGRDYRAAQLRGYQQYERFLSRIITDTARFVYIHQLEVFLERNLPDLYAFKTDSTFVSDEEFLSHYGVTERQAVEHYTNWIAVTVNNRRRMRTGRMWDKYVKAPIETEHIRLDTVIRNLDGDFVYDYVQTIRTRPALRKVDIVLDGEILEEGKRIYTVPRSDALTFYISSLSSFVDPTERYLTKVIERRAEANVSCRIDFRVGRTNVEEDYAGNAAEMEKIRNTLRRLLVDEVFEMDSIIIAASASPEGPVRMNDALSAGRAAAVSSYFSTYTRHLQDSLAAEAGMSVVVDDSMYESGLKSRYSSAPVAFRSRSAGENWPFLDAIVDADTLMGEAQKERYHSYSSVNDIDRRERAMQSEPWYPRMKREIYPRLRTVQFQFVMHRRGMLKDTVHTTELDTVYMNGVMALREREYEKALECLSAYNDYNTAIAYVSLDRNVSAMNILQNCERTARVNYMLAVLYSRQGDDRNAVQCYLRSCQQDPSYVHRGNLDPEISSLIRMYDLNKEQ